MAHVNPKFWGLFEMAWTQPLCFLCSMCQTKNRRGFHVFFAGGISVLSSTVGDWEPSAGCGCGSTKAGGARGTPGKCRNLKGGFISGHQTQGWKSSINGGLNGNINNIYHLEIGNCSLPHLITGGLPSATEECALKWPIQMIQWFNY